MLESLLLSTFGAALGVAFAYAAMRVLRTLEIRGLPRLDEVTLDARVLAFVIGITLLTGILSGLAPALQMPALGIASALREGDRQAGIGMRKQRRGYFSRILAGMPSVSLPNTRTLRSRNGARR